MLISADKKNIDHVVYNILKDVGGNLPLVAVTRLNNFEFNDELLKLDKYVLINYSEFDWNFNWGKGTPIFGKNIEVFRDKFPGEEWGKFIDFVKTKPPLLTFQRELLKTDVTDTIKPIEFPNWHPPMPIQSKEQYDARPINVFNFWGRSHELRVQLHANIWGGATKYGYSVCDNIYHFDAFMREQDGEKWVSLYMPHYSRVPIENIIAINGMSKLSISLGGAGRKCFRHMESPLNSAMLMWSDDLAWSFPWVHSFNCIKCEIGGEFNSATESIRNHNLYDIYREGVWHVDKYRIKRYVSEYIEPTINEICGVKIY